METGYIKFWHTCRCGLSFIGPNSLIRLAHHQKENIACNPEIEEPRPLTNDDLSKIMDAVFDDRL